MNSTISLEGAVRWMRGLPDAAAGHIRYGCFDWDPFAALLPNNVGMVQQDVSTMLARAFELMGDSSGRLETQLVACLLTEL